MMSMIKLMKLLRDPKGSMTVEVALLAPILGVMTFGIFEAGMIVSRQHELQSGAAEVEMIALTTADGGTTSTGQLKNILRESLGLTDNDVMVRTRYRCGTEESLKENISSCEDTSVVSTYVEIEIRETYTPTWKKLGIGSDVNFQVDRTVQIS